MGNLKTSKAIKVIIKRPGKVPFVTYISNTLKNLQTTVVGHIETVTIAKDCVIICNENGALNDMAYNCTICGSQFFGTIIFAGVDGDDFGDLMIDFKDFKKLFRRLWEI